MGPRTSAAVVTAAAFALLSCSSSSSGSSASCDQAEQCLSADCHCNLGVAGRLAICDTDKHTCESVDEICQARCAGAAGGVASEQAVPNVVGSDECNAFCDEWSKQCGGTCAIQ